MSSTVAAVALAKRPLPHENTPLTLRLVAAQALAIVGDPRAMQFVAKLARSIPNNPDVHWALSVMRK
jgi:hypothetical protein